MDAARRSGAIAVNARRRFDLILRAALGCALAVVAAVCGHAQIDSNERAFPQSKAEIEKALRTMQPGLAGRLPALEGFAEAERPLDRYQRGYYQASVQVSSSAGGGCVVRVSVKLTAWYSDPLGSRSGYQLLNSNGRLEGDLLDRLGEQVAKVPVEGERNAKKIEAAKPASPPPPASEKPAPAIAEASNPSASSPFTKTLAAQGRAVPRPSADS